MVFYHNSPVGAPVQTTDQNGNVSWTGQMDPFGSVLPINPNITQNLRFPGQYFDQETGLHYNTFRDYDPSTGRYIESDPIGLAGGINTYGYVEGNPVNAIDPLGLVNTDPTNQFGPFGGPGGMAGGGSSIGGARAFCPPVNAAQQSNLTRFQKKIPAKIMLNFINYLMVV
ncbi:MAG: RHS repeat-associated core domain-containing protein [Methylobacter sp.]